MSLGIGALKLAACRYVRSRTDLSLLSRLLLEELIDRYNVTRGCAWPSRTFLAARLGRGPTQIGEAFAEVQRAGLVQIGKSLGPTACGHRHNLYVIDLQRLAVADPDHGGHGAKDQKVGVAINSMLTMTTDTGSPRHDHRKTGEIPPENRLLTDQRTN